MASKDAAKKQWMPGLARHPYIKKGGKDETYFSISDRFYL